MELATSYQSLLPAFTTQKLRPFGELRINKTVPRLRSR
jgi:hypothetical protein